MDTKEIPKACFQPKICNLAFNRPQQLGIVPRDNESTESLEHLLKKTSDLFYLDTRPEWEG